MLESIKRIWTTATIFSLIVFTFATRSTHAQGGGTLGILLPPALPQPVAAPPAPPPANPDQSFSAPQPWATEMTYDRGWRLENPRMLADVNGDGKQDMVGFGNDGVWVGISTGKSFTTAFVLADFGYNSGWRVAKHVRATGDINGDKLEDVVGFGDAGVYRALSTGSGFGPATFVIADFGYNQGWRVDRHVRLLADVNGDGRKDIVAFGDAGVWLSLATADGHFTAPAFVLADFGYNQGWTPTKHIRTTADVNGDGRQDIVAFGDNGVYVALSTGTGFGPTQFVLGNFGYLAGGWRVDRHPRMLVDMNRDGKADIVGFGDAGVWIAYSTGSSFASAQFVLADFGYNQGWRIDRHPRFVADLNGDGYQDIVGYGEDSVYRALGGPGYFGPMRGVLRALVATAIPLSTQYSPNDIVRTDLFQRLVGDVTGDGLQDLVATNDGYLIAAPSSPLPPPPPPDPPTNPLVTGSTTSSLSIAWTAPTTNNHDTRQFFITYYKSGDTSTQTVATSASNRTYILKSLASDTTYCFSVQAESMWGVSFSSPMACGRTNAQTINKGPFTITIWMARQEIISGTPPYVGSFGPISQGANISVINFPTQYPAVLLVKPGHSTDECFTNQDAVVQVWGDMTAAQKQAIWGTANLSISGSQQLNFVGCTTAPYPQLPNLLPVNITFTNP